MHELSLASEIHRACRSRLAAGDARRLVRVRVAVGDLAAVEPDLLRYAWTAITASGPDAGAELVVEWRPASQRCESCGARPERPPGSWWPACPRCGQAMRIEGGDALDLLEFSHAPAPAGAGSAR